LFDIVLGIPAILERPSSGNLSSFDVYMQPRFRGRLRNVLYKNCSQNRLVQPVHLQISGGVSLIPNHHCSGRSCGTGLCLTTDNGYQCLCDDTDYQGDHCQHERQPNELTFNGQSYLTYRFDSSISSIYETIDFQMKTMHYQGLLVQLFDQQLNIRLKQGQIVMDYRWNDQMYESSSKDLYLVDNQWHQIQLKRKFGQITMMIDEYHLQFEHDSKIEPILTFNEIFLAGNHNNDQVKFHGCLKDMSIAFNDSFTLNISQDMLINSNRHVHEHGVVQQLRCSSLLEPIEFLISSSFVSMELPEHVQQMNHSMPIRS
jgi:hypothetical protein